MHVLFENPETEVSAKVAPEFSGKGDGWLATGAKQGKLAFYNPFTFTSSYYWLYQGTEKCGGVRVVLRSWTHSPDVHAEDSEAKLCSGGAKN